MQLVSSCGNEGHCYYKERVKKSSKTTSGMMYVKKENKNLSEEKGHPKRKLKRFNCRLFVFLFAQLFVALKIEKKETRRIDHECYVN